jgi:hypothetical protein
MVAVLPAQAAQVAGRQGIDARGAKLATHLGGDVLVEVEAELAHPVVPRPCSMSRCLQRSAWSEFARISASIAALWQ